jgi:hypothetical protein
MIEGPYATLFRSIEDHSDWNKYFEYFKTSTELDSAKKEELIEFYSFFKQELGRDYMERCYNDGKNMVNNWLWSKGWHYHELKWLFHSLFYFKKRQDCNYSQILGHIRSNTQCNRQGIPFLWAGDSLRKTGFEVVFEPSECTTKKPDLKIVNPINGEVLYVEISRLNESDSREKSAQTYHRLVNLFNMTPPQLTFSGKIHDFVDDGSFDLIKEVVYNAKKGALEKEGAIERRVENTYGVLEFIVAHDSAKEAVQKWVEERPFTRVNHLHGIPLDFNETKRLISKIGKEAEQIPQEFAGLIYVPLTPLYYEFARIELESIETELKAELRKHTNIVGICLISHIIASEKEEIAFIDLDFFQQKTIHSGKQQTIHFILNPACEIRLFPDTLMRVYSSFWQIFQ